LVIVFESSHPVIEANKDTLEQLLRQIVDACSSSLDLTNLEAIIVTDDFGGTIERFQEERGMDKTGYTNDAIFGRAIAKVLRSKPTVGAPERAAILDSGLVLSMLMEQSSQLGLHFFHHELCHVHDEGVKVRLFPIETRIGWTDDLVHVLRVDADDVWGEYVACRLSASTIPDGFDLFVPFLLETVPQCRERADEIIIRYRFDGDINVLYSEIRELSGLVLRRMANVLGSMHGLERPTCEEDIECSLAKQSGFLPIWKGLDDQLASLFSTYPEWTGIEVLDGLGQVVLRLWNVLGIYPESRDDGSLYIGVPFRTKEDEQGDT